MEALASNAAIVRTPLVGDDPGDAGRVPEQAPKEHPAKERLERRALAREPRRSIDRRTEAESEINRTSLLRFKEENLSHVSHELLLPLNAIYQFASILSDHIAGELNAQQHEYLTIVLKNVKQLESMVDDLFEGTRIQTDGLRIDPQCTSVRDAVAYTVISLQGAATAKGIALSTCTGDGAVLVYADPTRLRQMLLIVVDNAIKFTPAGGTVHIGAHVSESDPAVMLLEVADSGCGIDPNMTERIFERLVQGSDVAVSGHRGLGLGLYICKDLVVRHGGKIWAGNAPGTGAVLSITLPRFSLTKLLLPAFRRKGSAERPVSIVVTELSSRTGWRAGDVRAEHSRKVRKFLQRCLLSDEQVLLPKMSSDGMRERFIIVTTPDGGGAAGLAARILDQVAMREFTLQAGLTLSTRCRLLETFTGGAGTTPESRLEEQLLEFSTS
jgi:signal transduction histidine kinase